jgi:hypothetical protein
MKVNENLIWDYSFRPEDYQTEAFRRWYIARVLCRGTSEDVRNVGLGTIYRYLPALVLPLPVRELWEWFFSRPEIRARYEHLDRQPAADFAPGLPSPFVRR